MSKQIEPTKAMLSQIEKVTGAKLDPSNIAVFEAIALNTSPLSKRGSIYQDARPQPSLLNAMADFVNKGGAVPLHTLHNQRYELPVGRVFQAQVQNDKELRCLFFVPLDNSEGAMLASKLNSGTIDEVSVGMIPAQAVCSKCDFDYLGADASNENFYSRTCPNDHTIGDAGTHLKLEGLQKWLELSLVSLGAAKNAKIVGRAKARLSADDYASLAASGRDPDAMTVFATAGHVCAHEHEHPPQTKTEAVMADENLAAAALTQIAQLSADKAKVDFELKAAADKVTALEAKLSESDAKVAELTAQVADAADALKLKDEHDKTVAFLTEACRAAMVASGVENPTVPATVPEILAAMDAAKVKLHNLPVDGVAEAAADSKDKSEGFLPASAFTARK